MTCWVFNLLSSLEFVFRMIYHDTFRLNSYVFIHHPKHWPAQSCDRLYSQLVMYFFKLEAKSSTVLIIGHRCMWGVLFYTLLLKKRVSPPPHGKSHHQRLPTENSVDRPNSGPRNRRLKSHRDSRAAAAAVPTRLFIVARAFKIIAARV